MPTRNVVLTERNEQLLKDLIGSGRYQNASEILREGLRLIEQREAADAAKLSALREAANVGWADIEAGRYRDVADDELDAFIASLGEQASQRLRARA